MDERPDIKIHLLIMTIYKVYILPDKCMNMDTETKII